MKKITLAALASLALTSASAANYEFTPPYTAVTGEAVEGVQAITTNHSRSAAQSIVYSIAGEVSNATAPQISTDTTTYAQALLLSNDIVAEFAGAQITKFHFYIGGNITTQKNKIFDYQIFLTTDLQKEPFYTQEFSTTSTKAFDLCTVLLDQPYTISKDTPVYIGMIYTATSTDDYSFVYDGIFNGNYSSGWYAIKQKVTEKDEEGNLHSVEKLVWDNCAADIGSLCLSTTIEGDNLPDNRATVNYLNVQSVINQNLPFRFDISFTNYGATPIKNIEYEYVIGDEDPINGKYTLSESLEYGKTTGLYSTENVYTKTSGDTIEIKFTITGINGNPNVGKFGSASAKTYVLGEGKGYKRNIVVEEFTGIKCGFCPLGIVAMESIREDFPDGDLIPIAVHANVNGTDPMYASSWGRVIGLGSGGAPDAIINREQQIYPDYSNILEYISTIKDVPALGKVELTYSFDADTTNIILNTTTEFAVDVENAADKYALSFAITEDYVGPYEQTNYYSGGKYGECGGWEKKSGTVKMKYNDVARQLIDFKGTTNSIPDTIVAEEQYTFEYTKRMSSNIGNVENINVIAYLLDKATGVIVNACMVKHTEGESGAGVTDVIANDNNAPVEYFNLQGVPVVNPENGVYIRRQGSSVSKVYVK